jgi:hypothetical protein
VLRRFFVSVILLVDAQTVKHLSKLWPSLHLRSICTYIEPLRALAVENIAVRIRQNSGTLGKEDTFDIADIGRRVQKETHTARHRQ